MGRRAIAVVVVFASIASACSRREDPAGIVATYVASWAREDAAVRATITGSGSDELAARIGIVRRHLRAPPALDVETVSGTRVDGVATLPMQPSGVMRVPIRATVTGGRVRASPAALHRDLDEWPALVLDRRRVTPGRLLDRDGAPLDADRDAVLIATVSRTYRDRRGGGWSFRLTGDGDELASVDAPPASDVRLGIDPVVQAAATSVSAGDGRALVAVDASTGQIVAFAGERIARKALGATALPVGSVFKIATAVAALGDGRSPEDRMGCPAADVVEGRAVVNASRIDLGELSLRRAFALSCNTSFARLGADLGGAAVREAALALGFDAALDGIDDGRVERPASDEDAAAFGFGASGASSTPVALASVAATLAAGGVRRPPSWELQDSPGRQAVPESAAGAIVAMMRDAVENGTARRAAVEGVEIAAKTGTPRRVVDGVAVDDGITVAIVRVGDRTLGVAAVVLGGGVGGRSAAPLIAEFVRLLLRTVEPA